VDTAGLAVMMRIFLGLFGLRMLMLADMVYSLENLEKLVIDFAYHNE
jgi:hypothetical protein